VTRDTDGPGPTRRELLSTSAAAALAGLAGCGGRLPDRFGRDPPTIDGEALVEATRGDPPTVPETLPVALEASFVDDQRATARSRLDATPAPFDRATIPNGVMRERLNDEYDRALKAIRDASASGAPSRYERLGHAAGARTSAHEVRAAWDAIESRLTADDLRGSIPAVRDDVDAFRSRWSHVGDDPVRAAVVHAEIEREIRGARRWLSVPDARFRVASGQPLPLADLAVDVERARTDVAVGSYLFDRFRASLDDPTDLRDRLTAARDALDARLDPLPPEGASDPTSLVDRDVDATTGVRALAELASDARYRAAEPPNDDGPRTASAVVDAALALTYVRAFDALRARIEGGDDVAVTTAGDVATLRSEAIAAVEAARDDDRAPLVVDALLPRFATNLPWTDGRFDGPPDDVRVSSASRDAIGYVLVSALCGALPSTAETVADALRG
jgi:hypothetical protein